MRYESLGGSICPVKQYTMLLLGRLKEMVSLLKDKYPLASSFAA